jgi:transcription initiation factor TFIIIB Brf1 subunit/transcription initiation factor TFIIB
MAIPRHTQAGIESAYMRAVSKKLIKYKEEIAMAAIIYLTCNKVGPQRQIDDICAAIFGEETEDKRTRKSMVMATRRAINELSRSLGMPYSLESPEEYLTKIGNSIGMSYEIRSKTSAFIAKHWKRHDSMSGHMPHVIAGAVVAYILKAENLDPQIKKISESVSATEVSIRKVVKLFEDNNLY